MYACFLDLKSAFPSVSIGMVLARLRRLGVHGRMLGFIEGLFQNATVKIRLPDGSLADSYPFQRGLLQGNALSPLLFSVVLTSLLRTLPEVRVPGGNKGSAGCKVPGMGNTTRCVLAFADDLVLFSGTAAGLQALVQHVDEWATPRKLKLNHGKCGAMFFPGQGAVRAELDAITASLPGSFKCQGADIPIVEEYVYLGVLLRPDLDMAPACAARLAAGRRSLAVLKYFLWDFNVSLGTRAMVLKACLAPTLLAGSEVWGCSEVLLQKAQVALNEGVRSLYRFSPKSPNPPLAPAMRELHLQPVKASVLFRQCSLLYRTSLQGGGC